MADACLHSPAANNSHSYSAWDLHNHNHLGLFNSDMSLAMETMITTPPYLGCDSYLSTGYLEDVLVDYGNPTYKRRRLLYTSSNNGSSVAADELKSGESRSISSGLEESMILPEIQTPKEANNWALRHDTFDCSYNSFPVKDIDTTFQPNYTCEDSKSRSFSRGAITSSSEISGDSTGMKKKRSSSSSVVKRLVYPFTLVKPGGEQGDVTLNDINKRILMPPTRPIRHPVGDFACRPCVSHPHGPGLSGKAVVALTRIRTLGRGTVTIIRTIG